MLCAILVALVIFAPAMSPAMVVIALIRQVQAIALIRRERVWLRTVALRNPELACLSTAIKIKRQIILIKIVLLFFIVVEWIQKLTRLQKSILIVVSTTSARKYSQICAQ